MASCFEHENLVCSSLFWLLASSSKIFLACTKTPSVFFSVLASCFQQENLSCLNLQCSSSSLFCLLALTGKIFSVLASCSFQQEKLLASSLFENEKPSVFWLLALSTKILCVLLCLFWLLAFCKIILCVLASSCFFASLAFSLLVWP